MRRSARRAPARTGLIVGMLWVAASAAGCTASAGYGPVLGGAASALPTMVLDTGVEGEDCTYAVLAFGAEEPSLGRAVERALAQVAEATVLTDVRVTTVAVATGLYNRRCVRVRGSAAKLVRQVVLPMPAGHHGGHGAP